MKNLSKIFIFFIFIIFLLHFFSIELYPGWFKHYGGTLDDRGYSIQQTSDGGYVVAGHLKSYSYGGFDIGIYRLNSNGGKRWYRHYGGSQDERAHSILETPDGSIFVAGWTESYSNGGRDFAIYKLDSSGNKVWFKHYGGVLDDYAYSSQRTSDGGYVVAGTTRSYTYGSDDIAVYKLDSSGNKIWFKHYGGTSGDWGQSIQQTSDGGYIVAGYTSSYTYGNQDFAIYKLNSSGNKVWFKHYGGTTMDLGMSIQQTSDGGYIVAGETYSVSFGNNDFAIYKLDSKGDQVWFKHYGGLNYDAGNNIQQTSDGGYIAVGYTRSFSNGADDIAIYKLNSSGNKTWFKHYGGTGGDWGNSIRQTSEGGYIVGGRTGSFTYGSYDYAIYKLDSNGNK